MQENGFRKFLEGNGLTDKGVASRMSKAKSAEDILGYSLDAAVDTDGLIKLLFSNGTGIIHLTLNLI